MTTLRRFDPTDLLRVSLVNLDKFTETFYSPFYLHYFSTWPELMQVVQAPGQLIAGYLMGKVEGKEKNWHGHVTAVTVAPQFRRLGIASKLMKYLEDVSENTHNGYFVDLYVRPSNMLAVNMYKKMGYVVYRTVIRYYGDEDAYDMRKALKRDTNKESMIPLTHPVMPNPHDDDF